MSSDSGRTTGLVARVVAWCRGLVETVPPDMAQCEFECRAKRCAAERFDTCENRLERASRIRESNAKALPRAGDQAPTASH